MTTRVASIRTYTRRNAVRFIDSYASLLVLLVANFFLLELVDDVAWGAVGSTLLSAAALLVAISDPEAGHHISRRDWLLVTACVALAPVALVVDSVSLVGVAYLLPIALLVTARCRSRSIASSTIAASRGRPCSERSVPMC